MSDHDDLGTCAPCPTCHLCKRCEAHRVRVMESEGFRRGSSAILDEMGAGMPQTLGDLAKLVGFYRDQERRECVKALRYLVTRKYTDDAEARVLNEAAESIELGLRIIGGDDDG